MSFKEEMQTAQKHITNFKENASQKHNVISSHNTETGTYQKAQQTVLARIWRKEGTHFQLVGRSTGSSFQEDNPQKAQNIVQ